MPCRDSSSSLCFRMTPKEMFLDFEFAKITCGREITASTGLKEFCQGKNIKDILTLSFPQLVTALKCETEEEQFVLYLEWEALRSAIAAYYGKEDEEFDSQRCQITSIEYSPESIEVALVVFPPAEMPKILPCSLADSSKEMS